MKKWSKEGEDIGMGWERTDGLTYGVRVKQVKSYASFMVKSYENMNGSRVIEVSFKLGIDSRVHYGRGGQVCEILFELLEDSGLMSCVSLGKWDGKEEYKHVLAHGVDPTNEDSLMNQINKLSQDDILMPDGRVVEVNLFEFHDLVAICSLVCNNNVSPMGNKFCPWCICHKKSIHMVTDKIKIQDEETIRSISKFYAISLNLLIVCFTYLLKVC